MLNEYHAVTFTRADGSLGFDLFDRSEVSTSYTRQHVISRHLIRAKNRTVAAVIMGRGLCHIANPDTDLV